MRLNQPPAPGARALIRDEEWLIQKADQCNLGGWQLSCVGVSETVRNRHALFLTELEQITLIDPAKTELVYDQSATFSASRLYVEARLRQSAVQSDAVVMGQHAVMDALPFQLQPAHQVLGYQLSIIRYTAPFTQADRDADYGHAWAYFDHASA